MMAFKFMVIFAITKLLMLKNATALLLWMSYVSIDCENFK